MSENEAAAVIEMTVDLWLMAWSHDRPQVDWKPYQPLVRAALEVVGPRLRPNREAVLNEILSA